MRYLISAMLVVAGVIHLLPVPGMFGNEQIAKLYGITFDEPNLVVLMRHRAVLFGLLGALLVSAAFVPMLHCTAFIAGITSVVSFLWIAASVGNYNKQLARVVAADKVAMVCLIVGIAGHVFIQVQM
jgi:hypothetical protein